MTGIIDALGRQALPHSATTTPSRPKSAPDTLISKQLDNALS
jgi:hypothetical protein